MKQTKQIDMEYSETKNRLLSLYSEAEKINDKRFYMIGLLSLETGGRVSDLIPLKWSNFDFNKNTVQFKNKKSKKIQKQKFSDVLKNVLLQYKNEIQRFYGISEDVFFNASTQNNLVSRVSITRRCKNEFGFGFHEFRRMSAKNVASQGGVVIASKFLGHSRVSTTDIYLSVSDEDYLNQMSNYNI